jgi:hypothetical protein
MAMAIIPFHIDCDHLLLCDIAGCPCHSGILQSGHRLKIGSSFEHLFGFAIWAGTQ